MRRNSSRRGEGFVELLLVATLVALAVIVAAYWAMPDFEQAIRMIARDWVGPALDF